MLIPADNNFSQVFNFVHLEPSILASPVIEGAVGNAEVVANFFNFGASLMLLDDFDNLFF
ncbi:MAG: hypothetical protein ACI82Z_001681 [Cellvibrionaceae bacterium]|jgi:hypothetical protein